MIYVGVDPGLTGAIAALSSKGNLLGVWDTPTIVVKRSGSKRTEFIPSNLLEVFRALRVGPNRQQDDIRVCIELVHAMPREGGSGVVAAYSMGLCSGLMTMACVALDYPHEYVTPQTWKRALGLLGSDKAASILKAQQIIPGAAPYLTLKKHDGRAEAMLIAEFYRLKCLNPVG